MASFLCDKFFSLLNKIYYLCNINLYIDLWLFTHIYWIRIVVITLCQNGVILKINILLKCFRFESCHIWFIYKFHGFGSLAWKPMSLSNHKWQVTLTICQWTILDGAHGDNTYPPHLLQLPHAPNPYQPIPTLPLTPPLPPLPPDPVCIQKFRNLLLCHLSNHRDRHLNIINWNSMFWYKSFLSEFTRWFLELLLLLIVPILYHVINCDSFVQIFISFSYYLYRRFILYFVL